MTDELNEGTEVTVSAGKSQREMVKQQLLRAGMLVTDIEIPDIPDEYLETDLPLIILPPNSPSVAQLVDEDRGEY
jgi:hypothetical protein